MQRCKARANHNLTHLTGDLKVHCLAGLGHVPQHPHSPGHLHLVVRGASSPTGQQELAHPAVHIEHLPRKRFAMNTPGIDEADK
jgi:hypothetical protein